MDAHRMLDLKTSPPTPQPSQLTEESNSCLVRARTSFMLDEATIPTPKRQQAPSLRTCLYFLSWMLGQLLS